MTEGFVHLRVLSEYSLYQSSVKLDQLCANSGKLNLTTIALTDSTTIMGITEFQKEAKKNGIRPIVGANISIVEEDFSFSLLLLCKDIEGYKNLCKIITLCHETESKEISYKQIQSHASGLVAISNEIPESHLGSFKELFAADLYIEITAADQLAGSKRNRELSIQAERHQILTVATAEVRYLGEQGREIYHFLKCINQGLKLSECKETENIFDLRSAAEVRETLCDYLPACDRTIEIAEKCNFELNIQKSIYYIPNAILDDPDVFLREQSMQKLTAYISGKKFSHEKARIYLERLDLELETFAKHGLAMYFLVVSDYVNWAKKNGILVGPGRGSAPGSLVVFSMGITEVDPIKFGLHFERFFNSAKPSMPDIDADFEEDRRREIIGYLFERYGKQHVSYLSTFGHYRPKGAFHDLARIYGLEWDGTMQAILDLSNEMNWGIETCYSCMPTYDETLEKIVDPIIANKIRSDHRWKTVFEKIPLLEGYLRSLGTHACGVLISEQPIFNSCPERTYDGRKVAEFDKDAAEEFGLVKFDLLGLNTLDCIQNVLKAVRKREAKIALDWSSTDDVRAFALIRELDLDGIFYLNSSGVTDLCKQMQPDGFCDLAAIIALYRPGPLESGLTDEYCRRKNGKVKIEYEQELLIPILSETYGLLLYQEQFMDIACQLAGYSLSEAELFRRALGKRKPDEVRRQFDIFIHGCSRKNFPAIEAGRIFKKLENEFGYAFNKSHAVAYATITYQTALLKACYPAEFREALDKQEFKNNV